MLLLLGALELSSQCRLLFIGFFERLAERQTNRRAVSAARWQQRRWALCYLRQQVAQSHKGPRSGRSWKRELTYELEALTPLLLGALFRLLLTIMNSFWMVLKQYKSMRGWKPNLSMLKHYTEILNERIAHPESKYTVRTYVLRQHSFLFSPAQLDLFVYKANPDAISQDGARICLMVSALQWICSCQ